MEFATLNNGVTMPMPGYGVFQVSPEECERCVAKSGIPREEIFLVSKIWMSNFGMAQKTGLMK